MNGLLMDVREKDKHISRVITAVIHLLLLLLAIIPTFQHFNNRPPENMVIQFAEVVEETTEQPQSTADEKSASIPNPSSGSQENVTQNQVNEQPSGTRERQVITEREAPVVAKPQEVPQEKVRDFSSLFSGGEGSQNDNSGNSDLSTLSSVSQIKGTGEAGLKGRSVVYAPNIEDRSQKTGRVVVSICVDQSGLVTSAEYTQKGSTTNDDYLIRKAEESARKWRFSSSELTKQCGVITIDFFVE